MDLLRAALQGSSSMTDQTRVVLRQNLHGLVTVSAGVSGR
jgi:hypothetical protein